MRKIIALSICSLFLLPSCARYRRLQPIAQPEPQQFVEQNGIQLAVTKLSANDCKNYFGNKRLVKKYDAIQLSVKNNRFSPVTLHAKDISLPLERKRDVYKNLSLNTTGRVLASVIAGTLLAGVALTLGIFIALPGMFGGSLTRDRLAGTVILGGATGALGIVAYAPATATKNRKRNITIKDYINTIVLGPNDTLVLESGKTINKILFVPKKNKTTSFDLTLTNEDLSPVAKFTCGV